MALSSHLSIYSKVNRKLLLLTKMSLLSRVITVGDVFTQNSQSPESTWHGPASPRVLPPYGYRSLRQCRVITASRIALAVSQVASCFCPVARIEFVNPGFASSPFSAFLRLRFLARTVPSMYLDLYLSPIPPHSDFARMANNVRSSLGRAWQRANAA